MHIFTLGLLDTKYLTNYDHRKEGHTVIEINVSYMIYVFLRVEGTISN
jgi:hypothetical protein